jgi:hypothetical protein
LTKHARRRLFRVSLGFVAASLGVLGGASSCLPTDTRAPPGSIRLTVSSADEHAVTTVDGWSIDVERLVLGIGDASLEYPCTSYSEARYARLLDALRPGDQKLSHLFGLGQCFFSFRVGWPSSETLLGEGVTEADRELMQFRPGTGPRIEGVTVDFGATATRGEETKRVRWMLRQSTPYLCGHAANDQPPRPIELQEGVNLDLHIGVRGAVLFGDDASPNTAALRFDTIAAADETYGDADGEITLEELGRVTLAVARRSGPYGVGTVQSSLRSLGDYVAVVLLGQMLRFREDIACQTGFGRPPDRGGSRDGDAEAFGDDR